MSTAISARIIDRLLLLRLLRGHRGAAEAFHARFNPLIVITIRRILLRYVGRVDPTDLADFTAETWVALLQKDWHRLRVYDPSRCSLATWIRRLTANCVIDHLRQATRITQGDPAVLMEIIDPRPSPERSVERKQQQELFNRAAVQLSGEDLQFLHCWLEDDLAPEQHAATLGVAINTVYSRKFRLRQRLQSAVHLMAGISIAAPG